MEGFRIGNILMEEREGVDDMIEIIFWSRVSCEQVL